MSSASLTALAGVNSGRPPASELCMPPSIVESWPLTCVRTFVEPLAFPFNGFELVADPFSGVAV